MYLNHLTITTGDSRRSYRHEVDPVVMDILRPWIDASLEQPGELCPLPGDFADYAAMLLTSAGALVVTVFGRPQQLGQRLPLVSFGVAQRSRHAAPLWAALTQPGAGTVAPGAQQPEVPYLAVHVHPTAAHALEALEWLPDFERSVAWTWITRAGHDL